MTSMCLLLLLFVLSLTTDAISRSSRVMSMTGEAVSKFYGVQTPIIDTAVHVWGNGADPFPYASPPPNELKESSGMENLFALMDRCGVRVSLITQPINYKYDHSYLDSVIDKKRTYGIFLLDPQLSVEEGLKYISSFKEKGYVGMRLNPGLFAEGESMSSVRGLALYEKAGKENLPVNVMCFSGGISKYYVDIVKLLETHPQTKLAIDHVGFFLQNDEIDEKSFELLLALAKYPQVYVKFSALFRLSRNAEPPFAELDRRLVDVKNAYGAGRIMIGSDYPFTQLNGGYEDVISSYTHWPLSKDALTIDDWSMVLGGTACSLYNLEIL
jgi:predicted TIM-barrel fold metal-dependent hydrolase